MYEDRHGYAIMQFIEQATNGRLILGAGSLYGALNSLEKKGWIKITDISDKRRKKFLITEQGKEIAKQECMRIKDLSMFAEKIIGGK
ncbi:PadR family transcriptional regulator [Neobacillus sp. WH10]|uniref:PadR family transcriptional regulator n=1 Tax=Neobacillus sp. WH10 TaxID=3047873 RepID=UPI0024C1F628|nr:PadR family transcriptional regulator [Neobacillus sp. WH10]WHY79845.1 PadR family transcriptional regulator [Neobacillus sp. WH10]